MASSYAYDWKILADELKHAKFIYNARDKDFES